MQKKVMKQTTAVSLLNGLSAIFLLAVILSFIAVILNTGKLNRANQEHYDLTYNANRFMNGSAYLTNEVRAYAATGDKEHYDNYWNEINVLKNRDIGVANLQEIGITDEEQAIIDAMSALSNKLVPLESAAMENVAADKMSAAIEYVYGSEYNKEIKEINAYKEKFLSMLDERSASNIRRIKASNLSFMALSFALIIAVVVLQGTSWVYFKKHMVRPLIIIEEQMLKIAGGSLNSPFPLEPDTSEVGMLVAAIHNTKKRLNDYISNIAKQLNAMALNDMSGYIDMEYVGDFAPIKAAMENILLSMNDVLIKVNQSAREVSTSASQVSSGAQILAQGSTEQTGSVEAMSGNLNTVGVQIRLTAQEAEEARKKAEMVGDEMQQSDEKMKHMLNAMDEIGHAASQISSIIKAIEDIAFQTNILALNAAVEAARAGAAGKGFSVVADEVRNLAGKSAEASRNTAALIEQSLRAVRSGEGIAKDTAQMLQNTVSSAKELTEIVRKISSVSSQQAEAVGEVLNGMDQISTVVHSNSATAEESAAASEELTSQAVSLESLVKRFRLRQ